MEKERKVKWLRKLEMATEKMKVGGKGNGRGKREKETYYCVRMYNTEKYQ